MILPYLPWVAFGLAAAAVVTSFLENRHDGKLRPWTRMLATAAAALAGLVFLILIWLFIVADVSYNYVFIYTHAELALKYRIGGAWAGREGSLALWALFGAIITAFAAHKWGRDQGARWSLVILAGISAAFLGAVASQDMFARTSEFFLQQRPLGNGLNPTLRTDFFLIHPPMMFMAYALTSVPAAAALGHLIAGSGGWSKLALQPSRLNWLLYTAAMGLGGIWAYYTLGFGGFWAWDPVEVANLLPWLALTVYLHAQLHHMRYGRYTTIGPFLGMLPLLLTIFSTISTRSGLWVSVHAFTDPTQTFNPDAAGRFLDILGVEPTLRFHVGMFLALTMLFLALWVRRLGNRHGMPRYGRILSGTFGALTAFAAIAPVSAYSALAEAGIFVGRGNVGLGMLAISLVAVMAAAAPSFRSHDERKFGLDLPSMAYVSVLILGASLLIMWLWHVIAANGWSTGFYETRLPFLAAPAMIAMMVFMALPWGKREALIMAGSSLLVAVVAGIILSPGHGFIVLAIALSVVGVDRLRRAVSVPGPWRLQVSRWLLMAGAMLNVVFWLNPPTALVGGIPGRWPMQLFLGALAVWAWHYSLVHAAGGRKKGVHLVVFLLGGFFVAPVLAVASWLLARNVQSVATFKAPRMQQAGLYALHLAVAIALVGYGTSTYLGSDERATFTDSATIVGVDMNLAGATFETDGSRATTFLIHIDTSDGRLIAPMVWEPQAGAYYPLPTTLRTWNSDLYLAVESICVVPGPCTDPGHKVTSYEQTPQRAPAEIQQVSVSAHTLPGLGLVWAALAIFVHSMAVMMHYGRAQSGIGLSKKGSTTTI